MAYARPPGPAPGSGLVWDPTRGEYITQHAALNLGVIQAPWLSSLVSKGVLVRTAPGVWSPAKGVTAQQAAAATLKAAGVGKTATYYSGGTTFTGSTKAAAGLLESHGLGFPTAKHPGGAPLSGKSIVSGGSTSPVGSASTGPGNTSVGGSFHRIGHTLIPALPAGDGGSAGSVPLDNSGGGGLDIGRIIEIGAIAVVAIVLLKVLVGMKK